MSFPRENIDLDPDDWHKFANLGYSLIDLLVDYHKEIRDRKVWQPIPEDIKSHFDEPLPVEEKNREEIIEEFKQYILPYPTGNIHPRFWGWVHGTGTSFGVYAEFLAAMMNPNTGGREHIANYVERQVLSWIKEMIGYSPNAGGILTSGCSMANLTGLAVARQSNTSVDIRKSGLQAIQKKMTYYGSIEMHSSIQKSVELLGIGSENLRKIPVNDRLQINLEKLQDRIAKDRSNGYQPVAIIANVGTVNSGAIDDLDAIAKIAKEEDMWFHIDGAFGVLAYLVDEYKEKLGGIQFADSIAFDLHKWIYLPYEIGCALVKDESMHRNTFSLRPDYLSQLDRGLASFNKWPTEYGVELSRGFRALKAWMSFKEHGINKFSKVIEKNIKQARYLEKLIEQHENLELLAPVSLNIVCFRFIHPNLDEIKIEQLNKEILLQVQESGIAVFSSTNIVENYALRVAITNQRSKFEDFDILVDKIIEIGSNLLENI